MRHYSRCVDRTGASVLYVWHFGNQLLVFVLPIYTGAAVLQLCGMPGTSVWHHFFFFPFCFILRRMGENEA